MAGLITFPREPDADFAGQLYASVKPIIEGCRDDEWRARRPDLRDTRNPDFARHPRTKAFQKVNFETRMQLAMAFVDKFGGQGVTTSLKHTDPRLYGLQKFFYDCDLEQWVWHEVDLRAGAMPIPPDHRSWDLADALSEGGKFKIVTPRPPEIPMPRDNVMIQARLWYDNICKAVAEGLYLPIGDEGSEDGGPGRI